FFDLPFATAIALKYRQQSTGLTTTVNGVPPSRKHRDQLLQLLPLPRLSLRFNPALLFLTLLPLMKISPPRFTPFPLFKIHHSRSAFPTVVNPLSSVEHV